MNALVCSRRRQASTSPWRHFEELETRAVGSYFGRVETESTRSRPRLARTWRRVKPSRASTALRRRSVPRENRTVLRGGAVVVAETADSPPAVLIAAGVAGKPRCTVPSRRTAVKATATPQMKNVPLRSAPLLSAAIQVGTDAVQGQWIS